MLACHHNWNSSSLQAWTNLDSVRDSMEVVVRKSSEQVYVWLTMHMLEPINVWPGTPPGVESLVIWILWNWINLCVQMPCMSINYTFNICLFWCCQVPLEHINGNKHLCCDYAQSLIWLFNTLRMCHINWLNKLSYLNAATVFFFK